MLDALADNVELAFERPARSIREPVSAELTKTCSNAGATAAALLPIFDRSVGTVAPAEHG